MVSTLLKEEVVVPKLVGNSLVDGVVVGKL